VGDLIHRPPPPFCETIKTATERVFGLATRVPKFSSTRIMFYQKQILSRKRNRGKALGKEFSVTVARSEIDHCFQRNDRTETTCKHKVTRVNGILSHPLLTPPHVAAAFLSQEKQRVII